MKRVMNAILLTLLLAACWMLDRSPQEPFSDRPGFNSRNGRLVFRLYPDWIAPKTPEKSSQFLGNM